MNEQEVRKEYQISKEQCQAMIKGVCEGCGRKLEPIETVDNSDKPTYWVGCAHCSCFRSGVEKKHWEIARLLVEKGEMIPYSHLSRCEYENSPERLDYYLDSQTAGLSHNIARIDKLLQSKSLEPQTDSFDRNKTKVLNELVNGKSLEPKVEEIKQILNGLKIEYIEGKCDTCKGEKFYTIKNQDGSDRKVDCLFCADEECKPTGKRMYPIISNFNAIAASIVNYLEGRT